MKRLKNEEGIALVMVLILSAIALSIMAALLFMLTASTQVSGVQKRYKTAIDAGKGGAEVFFQVIARRGNATDTTNFLTQMPFPFTNTNGSPSSSYVSGSVFSAGASGVGNWSSGCTATGLSGMTGLAVKLNAQTSDWGSGCNSSTPIDPSDPTTYDMFVDLPSGVGTYRVYAKIVNTLVGNSSGETGLIKSGVVNANAGEVPAMNIPYVYTIELDAENPQNPMERAKYSILYLY